MGNQLWCQNCECGAPGSPRGRSGSFVRIEGISTWLLGTRKSRMGVISRFWVGAGGSVGKNYTNTAEVAGFAVISFIGFQPSLGWMGESTCHGCHGHPLQTWNDLDTPKVRHRANMWSWSSLDLRCGAPKKSMWHDIHKVTTQPGKNHGQIWICYKILCGQSNMGTAGAWIPDFVARFLGLCFWRSVIN